MGCLWVLYDDQSCEFLVAVNSELSNIQTYRGCLHNTHMLHGAGIWIPTFTQIYAINDPVIWFAYGILYFQHIIPWKIHHHLPSASGSAGDICSKRGGSLSCESSSRSMASRMRLGPPALRQMDSSNGSSPWSFSLSLTINEYKWWLGFRESYQKKKGGCPIFSELEKTALLEVVMTDALWHWLWSHITISRSMIGESEPFRWSWNFVGTPTKNHWI